MFGTLITKLIPVEPCGEGRFQGGRPVDSFSRVYGGEIAAQGLNAAGHTVSADRQVHSLHVSYLRGGAPKHPIVYAVESLRDSPEFSTRLVTASQNDRLIATMTASFQVPRPGLEHGLTAASDALVVAPESLTTRQERILARFGEDAPEGAAMPWPIDIRYIDHDPWLRPALPTGVPANRMWLRGDGRLSDDPLMHACVLAYASDLTMFEPVIYPHSGPPYYLTWEKVHHGGVRGASLDHSIWFHRPFRADEWLLHEQDSPVAHGARGLATGRFFAADGVLVASVAQEIVMFVDQP
ncbi:MAG: acyl-CoA thioesterase [Pseudonocardiales bacterium]|nr:acyl-CoA thioesterase [Pseudonocardiales bacterium]